MNTVARPLFDQFMTAKADARKDRWFGAGGPVLEDYATVDAAKIGLARKPGPNMIFRFIRGAELAALRQP